MSERARINRVVIRNYKSIAACDVALGPLTFLVGPNGSGKSNFLDALSFVSDSLNTSLDHAMKERGGVHQVRRRVPVTGPDHVEDALPIEIGLEFSLPAGLEGFYSLRIHTGIYGSYHVEAEECTLLNAAHPSQGHSFAVASGSVTSSAPVAPAALTDRLYLVAASGLPEFRPVYDALAGMSFYRFLSARVAEVDFHRQGQRLSADGSNLAGFLSSMKREDPEAAARIDDYLSALLPGFVGLSVRELASGEWIEFSLGVAGFDEPVRFPAASMSDGTLRALAILVALLQPGTGAGQLVPLVGIEEPETALHPSATAVILDALAEASVQRQVVVTSHSPELLDSDRVEPEWIRAVHMVAGNSEFCSLSEVGRSFLRDRLYTAGEMLRTGQLAPGSSAVCRGTAGERQGAGAVGSAQ